MTERERNGIPWAHELAWRLGILVALAALVPLCCVSCATPTDMAVATPTPNWVHIDGTVELHYPDETAILPTITIYKTYLDKDNPKKHGPLLCHLPHGTRVQMVSRVGDGVEIICPSGKRGWVTYQFIKELK